LAISTCAFVATRGRPHEPGYVPVVGCHGGAGVSTLCEHLGSWAVDAGTQAPEYDGAPYLLVARGTADGAACASDLVCLLRRSTSMSLQVHLAVVSDGCGPTPATARARFRNLRPHVRSAHYVPYVTPWRYKDAPHSAESSRSYSRAVRKIRSAVVGDAAARRDYP
jgi:hypothetical protein